MAVKRVGERPGAVLIKGMYIGNYRERNARTWTEGSVDKLLWRLMRRGRVARGWRRATISACR